MAIAAMFLILHGNLGDGERRLEGADVGAMVGAAVGATVQTTTLSQRTERVMNVDNS
jgi:hypothetical protein